ncbi:hypothetical protein A2164_03055 [Candidatus Curtissbacteria bacterium RBG_13_35_7]|uniref:Response regulatory domain-containing protein n=1 Tax=Candidatus Curtissbacteria bacterium RBG_13_35_7 TaxID=1797705 RepID=A0A1F5G1C0_9BACT|nr:MAG: hypothetical protein A2164_03055 [Candidatus Curtissbacteria bacterium RBG_13_35_7]
MVVEDEILLLEAIARKLKLSNANVISCSSGKQALDYLDSLDHKPDAIWLDYYLGDINGIDFMQQLRKNKDWANIPVVVVSNSASPEKVDKMQKLGVKKYIIKAEHRLDELVSDIKNLVYNKKEDI